jgi:protein SCO1/2
MQTRILIGTIAWLCVGLPVLAATPDALPALERVFLNPSPAPIADFTLTDHAGKPREFSSFRGKPALVFFGFTHCPDVCPQTLARLKALHHARNGALESAQVVLISVDGDRDTPAALKAYLAPLSPDFVGLTGDPKSTAKIAAQFAAVFFKEPAGKDGNYNVMHTSQVFVVDKAGRLRASFVNAALEDMATITALLIKETG